MALEWHMGECEEIKESAQIYVMTEAEATAFTHAGHTFDKPKPHLTLLTTSRPSLNGRHVHSIYSSDTSTVTLATAASLHRRQLST